MKNYKLHVSEGFKDSYGKEMLIKKEIENKVLETFKNNGYEHIKTPALEYIDVYSKDGSQKPDLYNLINRQGEVLSLCNDMTSSIARFVASNNSLPSGALKYCYLADTFRYPRLYQGKNHQFSQAGVEFIGEESMESDIAVIYLAYKSLLACNVKDFRIHLGSREFLSAVFHDFGIEKKTRDEIYALIDAKDYVTMRQILVSKFDYETSSFLINLMLKGGKLSYIDSLMEKLKNKSSANVLAYLKKVYLLLADLGIENIVFDFSIYSYAEYYTGIIFNAYIEGVAKAVVSGGRCDKIFADFGVNMADIGFGMDLDSITSYCLEHDLIDVTKVRYLSYAEANFCIALKANEKLREGGVIVSEVQFKNVEEAYSYAVHHGFDKLIVYKEDESEILEVKKC